MHLQEQSRNIFRPTQLYSNFVTNYCGRIPPPIPFQEGLNAPLPPSNKRVGTSLYERFVSYLVISTFSWRPHRNFNVEFFRRQITLSAVDVDCIAQLKLLTLHSFNKEPYNYMLISVNENIIQLKMTLMIIEVTS